MQSTRHDGNLAALHASSLPGHVLDVVVLTSDGGLLATMREASSPEHAIWHAPSADAAVDYLVGGRCGILIADLGTLRGDAAGLLARLHAQFPELVLMATGRRDEESSVAALVGDGRIYRFLHKPISPARANLFLGAATRRYYEIRDTEPVMLATVKTIARRPRTALTVGAFLGLVVIAAVAWFFIASHRSTDLTQGDTSARASAQIEELLGRANIALATGRLTEPRGDNALELYREVLALSPNHPDASAGVRRVVDALEAKVVAALKARDAQAGAATLTALQRAQPDHPRYNALYNELISISRSQTASASRPQSRTPPASSRIVTPPSATSVAAPLESEETLPTPEPDVASELESDTESETEHLALETTSEVEQEAQPVEEERARQDALEQLALAIRLRERGMLLEPADNNAFDRLTALQAQHPDMPEVREEQRRLASTLADHARTALAASNIDSAGQYLEKASQLDAESATIRSLRAQLQAAQARIESERVIPAGNLRRTREVRAEYPYDAQVRGIEGWVDIEFTIATDGTTRDLIVRDSQPKNLFDRSALEALRRWRFEPIVRNGQPVEQRAMLRMKYTLDNR